MKCKAYTILTKDSCQVIGNIWQEFPRLIPQDWTLSMPYYQHGDFIGTLEQCKKKWFINKA